MPVTIGTITTFPNTKADKAQVLKVLEESAEVYGAWQVVDNCVLLEDGQCLSRHIDSECNGGNGCDFTSALVDEIADTIQACANLAAAIGVDDMREAMAECEARNRARGRL